MGRRFIIFGIIGGMIFFFERGRRERGFFSR